MQRVGCGPFRLTCQSELRTVRETFDPTAGLIITGFLCTSCERVEYFYFGFFACFFSDVLLCNCQSESLQNNELLALAVRRRSSASRVGLSCERMPRAGEISALIDSAMRF